jgi:hypothetical protein
MGCAIYMRVEPRRLGGAGTDGAGLDALLRSCILQELALSFLPLSRPVTAT